MIIEARCEGVQNPVKFYILADKEIVDQTPKEKMLTRIKRDLETSISLKPVSGIYNLHPNFSYTEKDILNDFGYADTLFQVQLPYCLHLPMNYEFKVSIPEQDIDALIIHQKIWTKRANEDGRNSDMVDFFAEDIPLYFKTSTFLTPKLPTDLADGWESYFTGRNLQKISDQNGVYRYSKLLIQLETKVQKSDLGENQDKREEVLNKLRNKILLIINRLIDVYRVHSKEGYVRRLKDVNINLIYFLKLNEGLYVLAPNIETAMMNRSAQEIRSIGADLESGKSPDLYKLILLDAENSLKTLNYATAVLEAFQALDICTEIFLMQKYKEKGFSEIDCRKTLDENLTTKARLKKLLKDINMVPLNETSLWPDWENSYNKVRNDVIHYGKEPTFEEAKLAVESNKSVVDWLMTL